MWTICEKQCPTINYSLQQTKYTIYLNVKLGIQYFISPKIHFIEKYFGSQKNKVFALLLGDHEWESY